MIIDCGHNRTAEHRHSSLRRVDAVIMQLHRGGAISGVHDFTVQVLHAFENIYLFLICNYMCGNNFLLLFK